MGYSAFGIESSAWQSGFEAGKRSATALRGDDMTAEEALLHIEKVLNEFDEQHNSMGAVEQMRHESDLMATTLDKIRFFTNEVKK